MENESNLHVGHRERLTKKLFADSSSLADHEILELLLSMVIPRKDTNPIAHKLLYNFGSLERIFSADAEELLAIDGIGEQSAKAIRTFGEINRRLNACPTKAKKMGCSFEANRKEIISFFKNKRTEVFLCILLDKHYVKQTQMVFENGTKDEVIAESSELARAFAVNKPRFAIFAHNHPSGNVMPSKDDDITTGKLFLLCRAHSVSLADHVIVSGDDAFSYRTSGKLAYIKDSFSPENLIHARLSAEENERKSKLKESCDLNDFIR